MEIEQAHRLAISDEVADQKCERDMHQSMKSELSLSAPRERLSDVLLRVGRAAIHQIENRVVSPGLGRCHDAAAFRIVE